MTWMIFNFSFYVRERKGHFCDPSNEYSDLNEMIMAFAISDFSSF